MNNAMYRHIYGSMVPFGPGAGGENPYHVTDHCIIRGCRNVLTTWYAFGLLAECPVHREQRIRIGAAPPSGNAPPEAEVIRLETLHNPATA